MVGFCASQISLGSDPNDWMERQEVGTVAQTRTGNSCSPDGAGFGGSARRRGPADRAQSALAGTGGREEGKKSAQADPGGSYGCRPALPGKLCTLPREGRFGRWSGGEVTEPEACQLHRLENHEEGYRRRTLLEDHDGPFADADLVAILRNGALGTGELHPHARR